MGRRRSRVPLPIAVGRRVGSAIIGAVSFATPDEKPYREMVAAQSDEQIDTWAADLFVDFAKRIGVGTAIAAFCRVTGLGAKGFQRVFMVGGGPDHVIGIDTAGELAAPIFELPRAIAGLRRTDPKARQRLIDFLVAQREVMSYTP
jgi:hypothetical protein